MSSVLAWIRKSKGEDSDIGLEEQRRTVDQLASQLGDDVDTLDLGVQTGFSSMTRDGSDLLDHRDDVTDAVARVRAGQYDYLVAYDDRRICRDGYFEVIRHAAVEGDCQLAYVADVADDDLTHDIKRRVERDTKEEEIQKARDAIEARKEKGYDHGRPKFGMEYDDAGHYQVPGDRFGEVLEVLELRSGTEDERASYNEIAARTGISKSTVQNIADRREWYLERAERAAEDSNSLAESFIETLRQARKGETILMFDEAAGGSHFEVLDGDDQ